MSGECGSMSGKYGEWSLTGVEACLESVESDKCGSLFD